MMCISISTASSGNIFSTGGIVAGCGGVRKIPVGIALR
jgi:hypothetical protein